MAKQTKSAEGHLDEKRQNKRKVERVAEPVRGQVQLTDIVSSMMATGDGSIEAQASQLSDFRLQPVQRQALAAQIGRVQGNRHLQRVMALLKREESIERLAPTTDEGVCPVCGRHGQGRCSGCGQTFMPPDQISKHDGETNNKATADVTKAVSELKFPSKIQRACEACEDELQRQPERNKTLETSFGQMLQPADRMNKTASTNQSKVQSSNAALLRLVKQTNLNASPEMIPNFGQQFSIQRRRVSQESVIQLKKIDHGQLTWADFQGQAPKSSPYAAVTYSHFHDPEISKNTPQSAVLTAVDTGETCKIGKREETKYKIDIKIDPANIKVKPYMWQEKSWAKAWTTDEEAREKACKADLVKKCVKSFTQAYAKITKDRKKAVAKQVAACKEAFKKDIASYSVTINDREITANSKQECPDPFGTEFGEEFEAAAKETITWTGEMAGQEATVTSKDDCTTTFVQECATKLYPAASTELLAHEQDHFNITNVLAGQAEAALHTLIGTFDSEVTACGEKQALTKAKKVLKANVTKLNNEYKKQLKTLKRTQDTYDLETHHGTVVEKQVEWSEKISEGLSE